MNDVDRILARRHDSGGDFWATPDGRLDVGSPFSTLTSLLVLRELGVPPSHEAVRGGLDLIWRAWRDDGAIRLAPQAPLHPCYTAEALRVLVRCGQARDRRVQTTATTLLESAHETGGWRCQVTTFGRGAETHFANPGATLFVLDALRFLPTGLCRGRVVDAAVESLLRHWDERKPVGPCHYGIGSLFMQVEYPFLRYNLFFFVYVLSFYPKARRDPRFRAALATLEGKLDGRGRVVVERPHRGFADLDLCRRGQSSARATRRYTEIVRNL